MKQEKSVVTKVLNREGLKALGALAFFMLFVTAEMAPGLLTGL